jgi:peptide/nickel transport system ATP-binding protein
MPWLSVDHLRVELLRGGTIVEDFNLALARGEIVGLVGESGSGKTSSALALVGYERRGVRISSAHIEVGGVRLALGARGRDHLIAYVPQDPGSALNPSLRIGVAVEDVVRVHRPERERSGAAQEMLGLVGLPQTVDFTRRFPHQLSGGQQQRVCIALALACEPSVLVLDEPTTGLDVLAQAHILNHLAKLREEHQLPMVYVTHDLAVVAQLADRILVMYAGRVIEEGPTSQVLTEPRHPYTRGLIASTPDHLAPRVLEPMPGMAPGVGDRPAGCAFAPRCPQRIGQCELEIPPLVTLPTGRSVRCIRWQETPTVGLGIAPPEPEDQAAAETPALEVDSLTAEHRSRREQVIAASNVSFALHRGESVALVGESGSGKTTIARAIAGLHPVASGHIRLFGEPLTTQRTREQQRRVQLIFQNASLALNPRHTVEYLIGRPAEVLRRLDRAPLAAEIRRLMDLVRLPSRHLERHPAELSGGERQRVAIARALAANPELIICDEITSALDVSVQAAIISLLRDLRVELQLSMLFISHDLGLVAAIADRTLVLLSGSICEQGPTTEVLRAPQHDYTQRLLTAAPSITSPAGRSLIPAQLRARHTS